MAKAKKKIVPIEVLVNYSTPLLTFMRGDSKEEGLILQIGHKDKQFRRTSEELILRIPDSGDGVVARQVEEYWPARHGDRNLLSVLKSLAARESDPKFGQAFQLADFRTTIEYIRNHGKSVYSSPYPQFKTFFQVGDKLYDMNYGMWPDCMNMRHDGPGIGFGPSEALVSELFDEDDVLLVVPKQNDAQIILPEEPKEEILLGGEAIIRSRLSIDYHRDFGRTLMDFCRSNGLSLRHATAGPGNPNEIYLSEDQKGVVTTDVVELWYPEDEGPVLIWEPDLVRSELSKVLEESWGLAIPHALISYLNAYPDKIVEHNYATIYKGKDGEEACMLVGRWEEGQDRAGVYLFELSSDPTERSQGGFPNGFRFLLVKKP